LNYVACDIPLLCLRTLINVLRNFYVGKTGCYRCASCTNSFSALNCTPGACGTHQWRANVVLWCVFTFFLAFFFLLFSSLKLVLGLEMEFVHFVMSSESSWIIIHCLSKSAWGALICRFAWFYIVLYKKKHPWTVWFRKNYNNMTWNENITKCHKNRSKLF